MPQRFSQQRERIYQTVLESRAHPTAEMVYQQLKPEMPRLSLGPCTAISSRWPGRGG